MEIKEKNEKKKIFIMKIDNLQKKNWKYESTNVRKFICIKKYEGHILNDMRNRHQENEKWKETSPSIKFKKNK